MRLGLVVAVAASLTLLVLTALTYAQLSRPLAERLGNYSWIVNTTGVRFKQLYGIPVLVNTGYMTAITLSATLGLVPLAIYASRRYREKQEYEEQLITLLLSLPGMMAASGSIADALSRAAGILRPPFSGLVEKAAGLYRLTGDIEKAIMETLGGEDLPPKVKVVARSIVVAAKSGGRIHEIMARLASFMEASRRLTKLAEARLAEYKMIAVLAVLAYAVTAGATVALTAKASHMELPFMTVSIDVSLVRGLFYYSLVIITAGSAVVIARVIHDYTPLAAKYMLMLLPISYIAYIASSLML